MRDLDKRDIITGDFILVSGDVVSNFAIEPALARHRARRLKDRNAIMTMVLREAGMNHRTKSRGRRPVFILDPEAERCLHYEEMTQKRRGGGLVNIDPDLLRTCREIEVREDLIDCYIDICTPEVLSLWSDNFDYQSVRKSFLFGVLKDYELNGKTIHTYILLEQYAARVRNVRAYDAVSKDIVSRWTYPICPDSNLIKGQTYHYERGNIYLEEGVVLARGSIVKKRTVIGRETSVGDGSVIEDSTLGRRCQIGRNVSISGSYIWDDVVIGDGSTVKQSLIANEAVIGRRCTLHPDTLISYGVRIADSTSIPSTTRLTRSTQKKRTTDIGIVGRGGEGYAYTSDSASDSDASNFSAHLTYPQKSGSASNSSLSSISTLHSAGSTESLPSSRRSSMVSENTPTTQHSRDFHEEATHSILDGLSKNDSFEVIHLELLSQRLSADADDNMVRAALVSAFMKRVANIVDAGETATSAVTAVFGRYKELLNQMAIFDTAREQKDDQVDFLQKVEKECLKRGEKGGAMLLFVVKEVFELQVVEEEGILQWWDQSPKAGDEGIRQLVRQFVEWIREAESSEEDDDEEEEADDD